MQKIAGINALVSIICRFYDMENNEARPEKQQPGNYERFKPAAIKKPKLDPVDAQIMTLLRQDDEDKHSSKGQDMDRGFFLSLYQDYKALPSNIKVGVKMQLMQVLLQNFSLVVILTRF